MKAAMVVVIGMLLSSKALGQQHKVFHVVEVKQYPSGAETECYDIPTGEKVCVVERWRVKGYTNSTDYELACSETSGKRVQEENTKCYPMTVGDDIRVQVFASAIAYPPLRDDQHVPDYGWYMIQSAKERKK